MAESSHPMGLPFQAWVPKKVDVSKWCQAVFVGVFFTPNITLVYRRSSQSTGCCVFRRFGYLSYRQATPRKVKYSHKQDSVHIAKRSDGNMEWLISRVGWSLGYNWHTYRI